MQLDQALPPPPHLLAQLDLEERRFLLLAALMLPLRRMQAAAGKGKPLPLSSVIIRDAIKVWGGASHHTGRHQGVWWGQS